MQTRRIWILGGGLIAVAAAVVIVAAIFADSGGGSDDADHARSEDTGGGNALGICLAGATDCVDTVVDDGTGDAGDEAPPDLDAPVVSEPGDGDPLSDPGCDASDPEACKTVASNLAIEDLAARIGVAVEGIAVVSIEYTVWDGCMGIAPTEGEVCTEIGIPGYKIILENTGLNYEYHTDAGTRAVLAF